MEQSTHLKGPGNFPVFFFVLKRCQQPVNKCEGFAIIRFFLRSRCKCRRCFGVESTTCYSRGTLALIKGNKPIAHLFTPLRR